MSSFANKSVHERQAEVLRMLKKYPDKVPVVIVKDKGCKNITEPANTKFLVPNELTVAQFLYTLRKRIFLKPDQALFLFFGKSNEMPSATDQMVSVYERHRDPNDDMLYAIYSSESTFG